MTLARLIAISFSSSALGFLLELLLAWKYGASPELDAFRLSQSVFLIGSQLLVWQLLPHVVVPMFTGLRARQGEAAAWRSVLAVHGTFVIAGVGLAAAIALFPEAIARWIAPGITGPGADLLPGYMLAVAAAGTLYVLAGTLAAALSVHGQFAIGILPPLCVNLCLIGMVAALPSTRPLAALGGGTVLGAAIAYAAHVAAVRRARRESGASDRLAPGIQVEGGGASLTGLLVPLGAAIAFGHAATIFVQRTLSLQSVGSIALFSFALRLTTLVYTPAALYGNTAFPALAAAVDATDQTQFKTALRKALARTIVLSAPLAAVLWVVRGPMVRLLFGTGKLDADALDSITAMFGWMVLSSPMGAVVALMGKVFSAIRNRWAIVGPPAIALVLLALTARPLAGEYGAEGVAMAFAVYTFAIAALQMAALQLAGPRAVTTVAAMRK
ncbi:MAG: lipid II flippase MurJ [Bryobacteraceae bacterium]